MALKPLFSEGGIGVSNSIGNITVIYSNADIVANNITSSANLSVTGITTLGSVSNVRITGGVAGYYLQTDGTGNLVWAAGGSGNASSSISNGTSNVTIFTSGGNVTTSVAGNANVFVVTGTGANLVGYLSASGNANVGNLETAGLVTATGNITGGNLITAGQVTATGNVQTSSNLVFANTGNTAKVYQFYNSATSSIDTVFI